MSLQRRNWTFSFRDPKRKPRKIAGFLIYDGGAKVLFLYKDHPKDNADATPAYCINVDELFEITSD